MSPSLPVVEAQPELLVIDATALLFRAYFGMRPRRAPDGTEVGAVFGLAQLVLQIVRREGARRVALVYDVGDYEATPCNQFVHLSLGWGRRSGRVRASVGADMGPHVHAAGELHGAGDVALGDHVVGDWAERHDHDGSD